MLRGPWLTLVVLVSGSATAHAADGLAGKWVNVDPQTRNITRLEISAAGGKTTIQTWGAGQPGEIDQGKVVLHLLADSVREKEMKYGIAQRDNNFSDVFMTVQMDEGRLVVETYTVFKDGSARSNYRSKSIFTRAQ